MSPVEMQEDGEEQERKSAFPCPRVSARDRQIYHLCKVEGKTQNKVGDQFQLTQARVLLGFAGMELPCVPAQQSLSKYSPTYDRSASSYWTRNITAQDPLSRNPCLSAEVVQRPVVTTDLQKKKGLYFNPEFISGQLFDKSAKVV